MTEEQFREVFRKGAAELLQTYSDLMNDAMRTIAKRTKAEPPSRTNGHEVARPRVKPLFSVRKMAQAHGIRENTLRQAILEGDPPLPAHKWGRTWRLYESDVDEWMKSQRFEPPGRTRRTS